MSRRISTFRLLLVVIPWALLSLAGCGAVWDWWAWSGSTEETADLADEGVGTDGVVDDDTVTDEDVATDGADTSGIEDVPEDDAPIDELETCETDSDCAEGHSCVDGACTTDSEPADDLSGLAVDPDTGEAVDFAASLDVGDTVTLEAPSVAVEAEAPLATPRLPGPGCICLWSVDPAIAGTFVAATECTTDFTVAEAGPFVLAVDVSCAGETTRFRQTATAEALAADAACTVDEDCAEGETCTEGACVITEEFTCTTDTDCGTDDTCVAGVCTAASATSCTADEDCGLGQVCLESLCVEAPAPTPTVELFSLETRTPYVVRFSLWLQDSDGQAIAAGVTEDTFRVYEDDERIDVTETGLFVTSAPNLPLRLVMVLDYTASMASVRAIDAMVDAAWDFVRADHFTATHEIGIIEFHDRTAAGEGYSVAVPLMAADSTGKSVIRSGIPVDGALEPGLSRVWDAVALAIETLTIADPLPGEARAIIFLTDGHDTTSDETPESLIASAQEGEIKLFPIGFGNVGANEATLRGMAEETGGEYFAARNRFGLDETFNGIAEQLQGHWNLTYITPRNSGTVAVRVEFDWDSASTAVEESFDAAGLAADVHQGVMEIADRVYDPALDRTQYTLQAAYLPRNVDRFRFELLDPAATFTLQTDGGLTSPLDGWELTPLGSGRFDLIGPEALPFGAFGNLGTVSVTGDVPVLQIDHDDSIYAALVQPKTITFDGDLWSAPYELKLTVSPLGTGTVLVSPGTSSYAHGESVTLSAVNGTKTFSAWSGDATGASSVITVVMDGDKAITATFTD